MVVQHPPKSGAKVVTYFDQPVTYHSSGAVTSVVTLTPSTRNTLGADITYRILGSD